MRKPKYGLDKRSAINLIKKVSNEFKLHNITYGLNAFLEPPHKQGEGFKVLIDSWVIAKEKHVEIMKFCQKLDYKCGYVHREWGTYIMACAKNSDKNSSN